MAMVMRAPDAVRLHIWREWQHGRCRLGDDDQGRSRVTVTLCALLRVQAADSHIYFRAMAVGKTLPAKVPQRMRGCSGSAVDKQMYR